MVLVPPVLDLDMDLLGLCLVVDLQEGWAWLLLDQYPMTETHISHHIRAQIRMPECRTRNNNTTIEIIMPGEDPLMTTGSSSRTVIQVLVSHILHHLYLRISIPLVLVCRRIIYLMMMTEMEAETEIGTESGTEIGIETDGPEAAVPSVIGTEMVVVKEAIIIIHIPPPTATVMVMVTVTVTVTVIVWIGNVIGVGIWSIMIVTASGKRKGNGILGTGTGTEIGRGIGREIEIGKVVVVKDNETETVISFGIEIEIGIGILDSTAGREIGTG